jgi:hypothetical protein
MRRTTWAPPLAAALAWLAAVSSGASLTIAVIALARPPTNASTSLASRDRWEAAVAGIALAASLLAIMQAALGRPLLVPKACRPLLLDPSSRSARRVRGGSIIMFSILWGVSLFFSAMSAAEAIASIRADAAHALTDTLAFGGLALTLGTPAGMLALLSSMLSQWSWQGSAHATEAGFRAAGAEET